MDVSIIQATSSPMHVISQAAGLCYGKSDYSSSRLRHCYVNGHMSPFEHASVTFFARGISRACSHQLVRHRLASYNQQSQRYCRIDTNGGDWYVVPRKFVDGNVYDADTIDYFRDAMEQCAIRYNDALAAGVKPEDARYMLPEACKTEIVATMNVRELFHFLDVRQASGAQWEIHELADAIEQALRRCGDEWSQLMDLRKDTVKAD